MRYILAFSFFAFLLAPLQAQKDTITWRDGTKTTGVKVLKFNGSEIEYKGKGGTEKAPAHKVKDLQIEAWREAYLRAEAPEDYVGEADKLLSDKKKFSAQYGYWRAGMQYWGAGQAGSGVAALQKLHKEMPESGFAPAFFVTRIQHYLNKNAAKSALKVAEAYESEVTKQSWSDGFEMEATFYRVIAQGIVDKSSPDQIISKLGDVAGRARGTADFVADLAEIQAADLTRLKKDHAKAAKLYQTLLGRKGLSQDVLARAYLGLGHIDWLQSKKPEDYHKAYLNFLRVYILAKDAAPDYVAEAMYFASKAVEKWNGLPTARFMAVRLRSRLRNRDPYDKTRWAKRN